MATIPPGPARVRALRTALRRSRSIGPLSLPAVIGLASGFAAAFIADGLLFGLVGTPLRQVLAAVAFVTVAAPVWLVVQGRRTRDAHDALAWLNGWETERWQRELGRRLSVLPRANPEIVDSLPDTMGLRPLRVELLAAGGRLDEAVERLALLPGDTPWQRFEREVLAEWVALIGGDEDRLDAMRAAAAEIEDGEQRIAARTMVAAAEARRAAVSGGDAVGPLADARLALGGRPGRYAFSYGTGVVASVILIGAVASAAVLLTAALLR